MKTATVDLINFLNSNNVTFMADLYDFFISDGVFENFDEPSGTHIYLTSYDSDIVFEGNTYQSLQVLSRGVARWVAGLESNSMETTIGVGDSSYTILGTQIQAAAQNGVFDNAMMRVSRAFLSDASTLVGAVPIFEGFVANVIIFPTRVVLDVRSEIERLNIQLPKNVYSPKCQHCLYDSGCQVSKTTFKETGQIVDVTPSTSVFKTDLTQANGYFTLGVIEFTSGPNSGAKRAIKSYLQTNGRVFPAVALPNTPTNGDTFNIYPGCTHTYSDCVNKFSNGTRFKGFPYVPPPESTR